MIISARPYSSQSEGLAATAVAGRLLAPSASDELIRSPVSHLKKPSPGPGTPPRLEFVDGIRALCAIYVVLHHVQLTVWRDPADLHGLARYTSIFHFGAQAVVTFIVVSGFCLMQPVIKSEGYLRGGVSTFIRRRARRLLPPYFVALALSILLALTLLGRPHGSLWDLCIPVRWPDVITHFLLLQNFSIHQHSINYVLWSIAIEWQIYFAFPFLLLFYRSFGIVAVVLISSLIGLALTLFLDRHGFGASHLQFLGFFGLGMAAAWVMLKAPSRPLFRMLAGLISLLSGAAWLLYGLSGHDDHFLLTAIGAAAILAYVGLAPNSPVQRILSFRPLVNIGVASYSLYLLHPLAIECSQRFLTSRFHLAHGQEFLLLAATSLTTSGAATALFFWLIERPCMNVNPTVSSNPSRSCPL